MNRRAMVAGNWKMNGARDFNTSLVHDILFDARGFTDIDIVICPPAPYLDSVGRQLEGSSLQLGAQNLCEQEKQGAFTGEIDGSMLRDVGCAYSIVGHSERRALYGETDVRVMEKFRTGQVHGLTPILCIGETLDERESGQTEAVLARQLGAVLDACGIAAFKQAVIAYEPVWAIGTGRTATPDQAQQTHAFIRAQLAAADAKIAGSTRILYGGSVKADNAEALFKCPDVDGGLIGGAALKAGEFVAICAAAQARNK
ncbi:triose-phosphate isomerase [Sinimarinibacterium sp. NLF-5-8]|uniref:triose-phosphate isomerase n=1 Tax=Sinimarinibacterium sp. NLF-5-8 TaxID=2698684 RepID=UPI00137C2043|nr:triose-phosphate isomerase [Sinimarinibacterium sp. NLF-5-8]QHS09549.1 triose-phosphate isomerase [Sinimarinibacterium sp. NLF-5-8]